MTILVCGASGLVGTELCSILNSKNIDYIGTYNTQKQDAPNMIKIDFLNISEIEHVILHYNIKVCIFLIVQRLTDICEIDWENVKKTNIDMVNNSAFVCAKLNVKFIHLSTDYVFDGASQPNFPNSPLNPLQNYGISKLISELKVKSYGDNYCIIRTPVLYGDKCKIHENAVTLIAKNIMDLRKPQCKEDNYCIRRPLHVHDLSLFILCAVDKDYRGIYHFYNPHNKFTKYEMCLKIAKILDLSQTNIIPNNQVDSDCAVAKRPYDTMLQDEKYNIYDFQFKDFDSSLKTYFDKYRHRKIDKDCFVLVDLDGTIINSSKAHYSAYVMAFKEIGISFIDFAEWNQIISNDHINNYFKLHYDDEMIRMIKRRKTHFMKMQDDISFTNNCESFLHHLINNNINFVVVTNTDKETVDIIKTKLPLLDKIKNWITREDYNEAKPCGDCYKLAMSKYYFNEPCVIGIEDTRVGFTSIKTVTDLIYIYDDIARTPERGHNGSGVGGVVLRNCNDFSELDCYRFNDYSRLFTN
jgi:dTDP-4-dehydrorhamnose reductase